MIANMAQAAAYGVFQIALYCFGVPPHSLSDNPFAILEQCRQVSGLPHRYWLDA